MFPVVRNSSISVSFLVIFIAGKIPAQFQQALAQYLADTKWLMRWRANKIWEYSTVVLWFGLNCF